MTVSGSEGLKFHRFLLIWVWIVARWMSLDTGKYCSKQDGKEGEDGRDCRNTR